MRAGERSGLGLEEKDEKSVVKSPFPVVTATAPTSATRATSARPPKIAFVMTYPSGCCATAAKIAALRSARTSSIKRETELGRSHVLTDQSAEGFASKL
jgi:hypothetical protein